MECVDKVIFLLVDYTFLSMLKVSYLKYLVNRNGMKFSNPLNIQLCCAQNSELVLFFKIKGEILPFIVRMNLLQACIMFYLT